MVVMKFGGTSVGTGERIAHVATITQRVLAETGVAPVVIVSAMSGVTNSLREAARTAANGDATSFRTIRRELQDRHGQAIDVCVTEVDQQRGLKAEVTTLLDWLETLCQSIYTLGELTPRGMDAVSGLGERLSARLCSAAMRSQGLRAQTVEATDIIVTDANYGNAAPLLGPTTERTQARIKPLLAQGIVPVLTGFIGATEAGVTTTLGRGSSDYSATILGHCLPADEVWIWTDVNGVMTADPRIVPDAQTLPTVSYSEMAELSFFGAKVLHPRTIQPVAQMNIPVRVLNSFAPEHPGTLICGEISAEPLIKGISAIRNMSIVTVSGHGMQGVPGVAGRVFSAVAASGTSILMITQSSSEQAICFVVSSSEVAGVLGKLRGELELELLRGDIQQVASQDNVAIVAVVGAGMLGHPGIASHVFGALADESINIISIAQGSSEYNLSLVVADENVDDAVRAIHKQFHLNAI
jgi:aspartate kinase